MSNKVYDIITQNIIEKLEAGTIPWRKPWAAGKAPQNLISRKPYRGVNSFILNCAEFASPYWLTFKQAQGKGGSIKKGSKSTAIVFWKFNEHTRTNNEGEEKTDRVPFVRYYRVFNLEQCDGIEAPAEDAVEHTPIDSIATAEAIVEGMPGRPEIRENLNRAFYSPGKDYVGMPVKDTFTGAEEYYSVLFHELSHSTGHASRLNRFKQDRAASFGSSEYSKEELIAECGAAFLCGMAGIEAATIENSAAYIKGWLKALRNDNKLLIQASGKAQKAADYILNIEAAAVAA